MQRGFGGLAGAAISGATLRVSLRRWRLAGVVVRSVQVLVCMSR